LAPGKLLNRTTRLPNLCGNGSVSAAFIHKKPPGSLPCFGSVVQETFHRDDLRHAAIEVL
jgi:hypothetical protein